VTDGWLQRTTNDVSRALTAAPRFPELGLWRVNAAMKCAIEGGRADRTLEILRPLLADDVLDREPESLLGTTATLCLILCDDFEAAWERYERIIDVAAPRGWLIALAHGCMLRAFARLRCAEIRDAEADARIAFEAKLRVAQPPAILWTMSFLVDALVKLDEPDQAEAALAAAGQQGDPPPGVLAGRRCCRPAPVCGSPSSAPATPWPTPAPPATAPGSWKSPAPSSRTGARGQSRRSCAWATGRRLSGSPVNRWQWPRASEHRALVVQPCARWP
jgi:hypothetical protein